MTWICQSSSTPPRSRRPLTEGSDEDAPRLQAAPRAPLLNIHHDSFYIPREYLIFTWIPREYLDLGAPVSILEMERLDLGETEDDADDDADHEEEFRFERLQKPRPFDRCSTCIQGRSDHAHEDHDERDCLVQRAHMVPERDSHQPAPGTGDAYGTDDEVPDEIWTIRDRAATTRRLRWA